MSLASRIVNIFIPSQAPQLAPADGPCGSQFNVDSHHGVQQSHSTSRTRKLKESWTMEEEEEVGRPLYLHVG